jgi:hypothetical protein
MLLRFFRKKKMDSNEVQEHIAKVLNTHRVMTLACQDQEGVWSAPVFYATDEFDLIWVSNPNSRHSKALKENPRVAVSIYNCNSQWQKIQGLQIEGTGVEAGGEEENKAWQKKYTRKFPFTGAFFSQKKILPEPLKEKVQDVIFYRLKPSRIVLVDNSLGFGFKHEFTPENQS